MQECVKREREREREHECVKKDREGERMRGNEYWLKFKIIVHMT